MTNEITKIEYDKNYYPQIRTVLNAEETPDSVLETAIEYCRAAGLDIMRKPIAIISYGGKHEIVFTIQAITTIAARAGWCGNDEIVFSSETTTINNKKYPVYGYMVVYKIVQGVRCAFTGPKVYLQERYQAGWARAGVMAMFQKCITAAALRLAFPEQLSYAYEESEIKANEITVDNSGLEKLEQQMKEKTETVEVAEVVEAKESDYDAMTEAINSTTSLEELKETQIAIKAYNPTGEEREKLLKVYEAKRKLLLNNAT